MARTKSGQFAPDFYDDMKAVTPNDGADLPGGPGYASGLYVGVAGTVTFLDRKQNQLQWTCPAGTYIKCFVRRVFATGTSATGIIALY